MAAIEDLMTDLEKRLRRLSSTALGGDTIKRIADEVENRPLVMLGIYLALALTAFAILWSTRAMLVKLPKRDKWDKREMSDIPALNQPAEAQIIMLVEAVMLDYSLARKGAAVANSTAAAPVLNHISAMRLSLPPCARAVWHCVRKTALG